MFWAVSLDKDVNILLGLSNVIGVDFIFIWMTYDSTLPKFIFSWISCSIVHSIFYHWSVQISVKSLHCRDAVFF